MKVVCVNVSGAIELTLGKYYKVLDEDQDEIGRIEYYIILNDSEQMSSYYKSRFLSINEWRELRINTILNS